ncbi:MAG: nucleotidyltransferase domain-containing protein [Thermoplasmata archaeon]
MIPTRALKDFLKRKDYVEVAYLFGSEARGREGPLSDIDIAVFLKESLSPKERYKKKLHLISEISSILKRNDVNLVVINDSPLLLAFNIIKEGSVLKCKKESLRVLLETRIMSRYLDRKFFEDKYVREGMRRIAEKGIL